MRSKVLLTVDRVTDDSTGMWKVGELEYGVPVETRDWLAVGDNRERLTKWLRWLADACENSNAPFGPPFDRALRGEEGSGWRKDDPELAAAVDEMNRHGSSAAVVRVLRERGAFDESDAKRPAMGPGGRDPLDEIREAAERLLGLDCLSKRDAQRCARVVLATPEALMAVAMEAHMLGRIYNKQGEPESPAEVVDRLERAIQRYAHPVLARAWRGDPREQA